jgi:hypothetical protein
MKSKSFTAFAFAFPALVACGLGVLAVKACGS